MPARLTIGTVARRAGVSVETIRYYQRRGLLPLPALPPGGIRRYPEETVRRLQFIKRAQQLGFALAEIDALLALGDAARCGETCMLAERKLAEIEARIEALRSVQAALGGLARACSDAGAGLCPIVESLAG